MNKAEYSINAYSYFLSGRNRRYFPTYAEARAAFISYFGVDYGDVPTDRYFPISIYDRKCTSKKRFFIGSQIEWLNI